MIRNRRARIVATLGPASDKPEVLRSRSITSCRSSPARAADLLTWIDHAGGWELEHRAERGCIHQDCCKLAHLEPVAPGGVPTVSPVEGELCRQP